MRTLASPQEVVEHALAVSRADGCVAIVDESSTANVRWANNTLTTNGVTIDRRVTVVATIGGASASAAGVVSRTGATDDEAIDQLVARAEAAARSAMPAEDAGPLVDGSGSSATWAGPVDRTDAGIFRAIAPALGEAFDRARSEDRLLFGYAEHDLTTTFLGTSAGLRARHDQPSGNLQLNAKSADGERSAWAGVGTEDFTDVDLAAVDRDLRTRLDWAQRSLTLPAGRYETILPPTAVADLMINLYWSAGARDAHDGRSAFSAAGGGTRLGETISDLPLSLRSDPALPGLACAPFVTARSSGGSQSVYDNGLPLAPTEWLRDGTIAALTQTRHSAALTGGALTPAIDNLILEGRQPGQSGAVGQSTSAGQSLDDLIGTTERGLLVTCLWYIREVDPRTLLLTGLTRDGVYLVERGEVTGAVNNFRFNESPMGLLRRIQEVGASVRTLPREWSDYFTRASMPPLRVADFNMSSVSQAH
ncbi:MAG: metallopeptidase TldD-related protein [Acidimicrobiales bacterium]